MSQFSNDPRGRYQRDLERPDFRHDPAQANAVDALQALYEQLLATPDPTKGWAARVRRLLGRPATPVRGLYLWGSVGRGKTYLMDKFYESLPFERKMRVHFHRFMRRVHGELKRLAGEKNPLDGVADTLAAEARVICFDEFFVSDITDAMILGTLLKALFARGVTLVATSNIPPADLYRDGLQRARFLPAIDLLQRHCRVLVVDGESDHRLRALRQASLYYTPLGEAAESSMHERFHALVPNAEELRADQTLMVEGRPIQARYVAEDVVWFEFEQLCEGPRSHNDYIELAREYHAVLISNVPALGVRSDDPARRFISVVDEFYDRRVKLILSAAHPLTELYQGERLAFEFQRTVSRLLEMQSVEYLSLAHEP